MIVKTLSGSPFLDEPCGGVYARRSFLVSGRSGTGKTIFGFQFARQGLSQDERCLILSTMAANDLSILAESLGFSFSMPIDQGHLVLLEYQSFIPGQGASEWGALPPEGFDQLREIIEGNSVSRVVLDTVLPWISVRQADRMNRHVFSFLRSCDRLGVTTMMTMPKPVSTMAVRLKKAVEAVAPISILLKHGDASAPFIWQTVKYLGESKLDGPIPYRIDRKTGLTPLRTGESSAKKQPSEPSGSGASSRSSRSDPVRFSSVLFSADREEASPSRKTRPPRKSDSGDTPARLAKVWKPNLDSPSNPGT